MMERKCIDKHRSRESAMASETAEAAGDEGPRASARTFPLNSWRSIINRIAKELGVSIDLRQIVEGKLRAIRRPTCGWSSWRQTEGPWWHCGTTREPSLSVSRRWRGKHKSRLFCDENNPVLLIMKRLCSSGIPEKYPNFWTTSARGGSANCEDH